MCAMGYLIAGFMLSPWVPLVVSAVLLIGAVVVLSRSGAGRR